MMKCRCNATIPIAMFMEAILLKHEILLRKIRSVGSYPFVTISCQNCDLATAQNIFSATRAPNDAPTDSRPTKYCIYDTAVKFIREKIRRTTHYAIVCGRE